MAAVASEGHYMPLPVGQVLIYGELLPGPGSRDAFARSRISVIENALQL
jgi:hypothetical protein